MEIRTEDQESTPEFSDFIPSYAAADLFNLESRGRHRLRSTVAVSAVLGLVLHIRRCQDFVLCTQTLLL